MLAASISPAFDSDPAARLVEGSVPAAADDGGHQAGQAPSREPGPAVDEKPVAGVATHAPAGATPIAIGGVALATALPASAVAPAGTMVAVALCAAAAVLLLRGAPVRLAVTLAGLLPFAFLAQAPAWTWPAGIAALTVASLPGVGARVRSRAGSRTELEAQLARCRRRAEAAAVVVMEADALPEATAADLRGALRLTDAVSVAVMSHGLELHAILDGADVDRSLVETRLAERAGVAVRFGWARFPDDALTLEGLLAAAQPESVPLPSGAQRRRLSVLAGRSPS